MLEPTLILSPLALCIFGLAAIILGLKSYRSYQITRNPLGLPSTVFGVSIGLALIVIGLPFLLTKNETVLLVAGYIGVIGIQIACIALMRLVWFGELRDKISFKVIVAVLTVWGIAILASDIASTQVVSQNGILVYESSQLSLWLKAILYIAVGWPLTYFYIHQATKQTSRVARLKLGCLGAVIFLASTSAVLENLTSGGQASESGGVGRLLLSIFTLLYALWPRQGTPARAAAPDPGPQPGSPSTSPAPVDYTAAPPDKTLNPPQPRS